MKKLNMVELDVSSEEWRSYTFDNGHVIKIDNPVTLFLCTDKDSSRVLDADGIVTYIPGDVQTLRWKPRDINNPVQF